MNAEESEGIQLAAADVESAQYELDHAQYDLRDQFLAALKRGVPQHELAKEAGMSLHQLQNLLRLPDEDSTAPSSDPAGGEKADEPMVLLSRMCQP